jgi:hypothetical protein
MEGAEMSENETPHSDNVVPLPGIIVTNTYVEVGDDRWSLTEHVLADPLERRRLVRTQVEELLALDRRYPLPEFAAVRQILTQMREAYGDVEPFNRPSPLDTYEEDE